MAEKAAQKLLASTTKASDAALALRSTTTAGFAERGGQFAVPPLLLNERLTTREKSDFTVALFDAWASLADVLTFYQERLANEGFLRTAQDQRSLYELSRLIGYRPRPGVSASVYLAFEVEDTGNQSNPIASAFSAPSPAEIAGAIGNARQTAGSPAEVVIPVGTKAKSTPTPGSSEQPQSFETIQELIAKTDCNAIRLRTEEPQRITAETVFDLEYLCFKKTGLRLQPNDYLAVQFDSAQPYKVHHIQQVNEDNEKQVTTATLFLDDLSPKRLILELKQIVDDLSKLALDESLEKGESGTKGEFEATRKLISDALYRQIYTPDRRIRLLEIDSSFQQLLCTRLQDEIERASGASQKKGSFAKSVSKTKNSLDELLGLAEVVKQFRPYIEKPVADLTNEVKRLDALIAALSRPLDSRAQILALISSYLEAEYLPEWANQTRALFLCGEPAIVSGPKPLVGMRLGTWTRRRRF